jgi:hypothetical protein
MVVRLRRLAQERETPFAVQSERARQRANSLSAEPAVAVVGRRDG